MPISLYTGLPGSGKSYEVVRSVILPALERGRAVVANIEGLDREAIAAYLEERGCDDPGELVIVDRHDPQRADFFPARQADGSYRASLFVPLGAVIVVDEAPFYWGTDKSILPAHLAFFREHRHVCAADGTACDLVVCAQSVSDVHRTLKVLVEFSIDCRKLSALGLSRKYTVTSYTGAKRSGKYVLNRATQTYDKRIFPLYKSFAVAHGKILGTDRRFTIWKAKGFWALVIIAPVLLGVVGWRFYNRYFSPTVVAIGPQSPAGAVVQGAASQVATQVAAVLPAASSPPPARLQSDIGGESKGPVSVWRIVGAARFSGRDWAVIRRNGFPLRYLPLTACLVSYGSPVSCRIGDEVFEPESQEGIAATAAAAASASSSGEGGWAVDRMAARAIRPIQGGH